MEEECQICDRRLEAAILSLLLLLLLLFYFFENGEIPHAFLPPPSLNSNNPAHHLSMQMRAVKLD